MKQELIIKKCAICGTSFSLTVRQGRKQREICDKKKCKKIHAWGKAKPVSFDGFQTGNPSPYRADIDYHGKPYL